VRRGPLVTQRGLRLYMYNTMYDIASHYMYDTAETDIHTC